MNELKDQLVYILVEEANFPFCLPPRQDEYLILVVYTDEADAKSALYDFMRGGHYPLPPPRKVLELSYSSVMDLVPEMEVYAEEEYGTKFSIQLRISLGEIFTLSPKLIVEKQHLN